jgi:hypothetical protein
MKYNLRTGIFIKTRCPASGYTSFAILLGTSITNTTINEKSISSHDFERKHKR